MNEKASFAIKILKKYAKENGEMVRGTTDLSPLEEWLILELYNKDLNDFALVWGAKKEDGT